MTIIGGIDEAGRGPVIGPMIVAAASFMEEDIPRLDELGVKDSKRLGSEKRQELEGKIMDLAVDFKVIEITPQELDGIQGQYTLNQFEAKVFSEVIQGLKGDKIFSDYVDDAFRSKLKTRVDKEVIVEKEADDIYLPVSAASILAKAERDRRISEIDSRIRNGPSIGSGYPSDSRTIDFLKWFYRKNNEFPSFARKSWKTLDKIRSDLNTRSLNDF